MVGEHAPTAKPLGSGQDPLSDMAGVKTSGSPSPTGQASAGRPRRKSVVAFDRYPLWLDELTRLLETTQAPVIATATGVEEALRMLKRRRPDVFLLGLDGRAAEHDLADALLHAASQVGRVATIVLSTERDPDFIEHCLSSGAVSYVLKTVRPLDLATVIRQALDRSVYLFSRPQVPERRELAARRLLTRREHEVLLLIAEGLGNWDVARRLWISVPTVKFHLSRIYEKIGVSNRTGAVRWAQRQGLLSGYDAAVLQRELLAAGSPPSKTHHA